MSFLKGLATTIKLPFISKKHICSEYSIDKRLVLGSSKTVGVNPILIEALSNKFVPKVILNKYLYSRRYKGTSIQSLVLSSGRLKQKEVQDILARKRGSEYIPQESLAYLLGQDNNLERLNMAMLEDKPYDCKALILENPAFSVSDGMNILHKLENTLVQGEAQLEWETETYVLLIRSLPLSEEEINSHLILMLMNPKLWVGNYTSLQSLAGRFGEVKGNPQLIMHMLRSKSIWDNVVAEFDGNKPHEFPQNYWFYDLALLYLEDIGALSEDIPTQYVMKISILSVEEDHEGFLNKYITS